MVRPRGAGRTRARAWRSLALDQIRGNVGRGAWLTCSVSAKADLPRVLDLTRTGVRGRSPVAGDSRSH